MNLFPIIILVIVGINMLKRLAEQSKQEQTGPPRERKRYPRLSEGEGETPTVVVPYPRQQEGSTRTTKPGEMLRKMDREFEEWFEEEQREEGSVVWEASQEDVEGFLEEPREPVVKVVPPWWAPPEPKPVRVPRPVAREAVKRTEEPALVPPTAEVRRPTMPGAKRIPKPVREKIAPVPAKLAAGVFRDMDDVRRGIIMSEILGPPSAFK